MPAFPACHAGGQRFESAWVHPVKLFASQGVFCGAQGGSGRPAGIKGSNQAPRMASRQYRHGGRASGAHAGIALVSAPLSSGERPASCRPPRQKLLTIRS